MQRLKGSVRLKQLLLQRTRPRQNRRGLQLKLRERPGRLRRSFSRQPKHVLDLAEDPESIQLSISRRQCRRSSS